MANYTWPDNLLPATFSLSRYTKTFRGASMFGHSGQNIDTANDRWKASMSVSIRDNSEGPAIEAILNKLRQGVNTISLYHFAREVPAGTCPLYTITATSVVKGSSSISINAPVGSTLLSGDMLECSGLLFQCAFDCVADSSSVLVVPIVGYVRKNINQNTAVNLDKASTKFRLLGKRSVSYGPSGHIMGFNLDFLEQI